MPKQLNNGQITQALQRAFGFKGRYIPMLDEVIVPVYNIQDPSPAAVTRLCIGTIAVATNTDPFRSFVQLFNPPGSGHLLNVTSAQVTGEVKFDLNILYHDLPGAVLGSDTVFRDRRNRGLPAAQIFLDDTTPPVGQKIASLQVDGALSQSASWLTQGADPRQPLTVLEPGQGVIVQDNNAAVTGADSFSVSFRWLEIPLSQTNPLGGTP